MKDMASERRRIFARPVRQVAPKSQTRIELPATPIRSPDGTWVVVDRPTRALMVLSDDLRPVERRELKSLPLPAPNARFEQILVDQDLGVTLLTLDRVVNVRPDGTARWQFEHWPWPGSLVGGAAFMSEGTLGVVVPSSATPRGSFQTPAAELVVLDPASAQVISRTRLTDDSPESFHAVGRTDGTGAALDAGFGQDGSQIWRITLGASHREPRVAPLEPFDRVLADLSPSGSEILTTPHGDNGLRIYAWDSLQEVAALPGRTVFDDSSDTYDSGDRFDYLAWYLDADRILTRTRQGRLLVMDRGSMSVNCQVIPGGFGIVGFDERGKQVDDPARAYDFESDIQAVTVVAPDRILLEGRDGHFELCVLDLSANGRPA